jgi:hypothetical protein
MLFPLWKIFTLAVAIWDAILDGWHYLTDCSEP